MPRCCGPAANRCRETLTDTIGGFLFAFVITAGIWSACGRGWPEGIAPSTAIGIVCGIYMFTANRRRWNRIAEVLPHPATMPTITTPAFDRPGYVIAVAPVAAATASDAVDT